MAWICPWLVSFVTPLLDPATLVTGLPNLKAQKITNIILRCIMRVYDTITSCMYMGSAGVWGVYHKYTYIYIYVYIYEFRIQDHHAANSIEAPIEPSHRACHTRQEHGWLADLGVFGMGLRPYAAVDDRNRSCMAVSINWGGLFLGCPCNKIPTTLGSILGPLIFGNSHIPLP